MNTFKTFTRNTLLSCATTVLVCTPAWADDTEIFFGGTSNTSVRPNIVFILDTSGSMTGKDGGSIKRIDRMKNALTNLLTSVQDVNVGLMRFTDPGGPVLYPARYVDEYTDPSIFALSGEATSKVIGSNDDAVEASNGSLQTGTDALSTQSTGGNTIVEQFVQASNDDAEQDVDDKYVDLDSIDLDMMYSGSDEKFNGVRMRSLDIPRYANILNAYLEFEVRQKGSGDVRTRIFGHDTNNSEAFQANNRNITSRDRTNNKVNWDIPNANAGDKVQTPNISSIVQEVVNRNGWQSQNNMSFVFKHQSRSNNSASRELYTHDGKAGSIKLHVEYEGGSAPSAQTIGLRFNEIAVPKGATVTSAILKVTALEDDDSSASLAIYGEDVDHSEQFSNADDNISSRDKTSASVGWTGIGSWDAGDSYDSPDLTTVVQEIVDRDGWCGNNSLSLILEPSSGKRVITSFDQDVDASAELVITYDTDSVPDDTCMNYKAVKLIESSNDDSEQLSDNSMHRNSPDLDLGENRVGLHYTDLPLQKDAKLNYAYLEFVADGNSTGNTTLTISAHDTSGSSSFSSSKYNISNRTKTSTQVSWNPEPWSNDGQVSRTPNIAPIINEVIANSGWASGKNLTFIIEGSGHRTAKSWDASNLPPKLIFYANESTVTSIGNTVRQELIEAVQSLPASGNTPIVDTLYEARQYFRGGDVIYGKSRGDASGKNKKRVSSPSTYTGGTLHRPNGCSESNLDDSDCSGEQIYGSPVYISPVTHSCQQNHIVLLTDGQANSNHSESKIKDLLNLSSCESSTSGEKCGIDLVKHMYEEDQIGTLTGDQNIQTHVVGLEISTNWLKKLAAASKGTFKLASSEQDLLDVFDTVVSEILADSSTFVEPSVTVNQFNRFAHRDDIYFALFEPSKGMKWDGNIKKYQLVGNPAEIYDNNTPQEPAINYEDGYFEITAKSFWSEDTDGKKAGIGGVASQLPNDRKILTDIDNPQINLNTSKNRIASNNSALTKALLGIEGKSDAYRNEVINWTLGLDKNDANRYEIGDPLHSRPELVTYDAYTDPLESYIFAGTNEGYLHAFDVNTGIEKFAFIPQELLPNLQHFYEDLPSDPSSNPRPYGLDGGVTVWTRDTNYDGDLKDTGEFARLYVGMRRGGRNYYALDVTDVENPKLMWKIKGGVGDFTDLGQTWSEPVKTKVNFNGVIKDVLIFAGGYDVDQDDYITRTTDDQGNAIFIVDAETGALLWSGGNHNGHDENFADMDYSIPSDVTVLDMNRDGLADQLYVGDMGGQIWRFDINNGATQLQHFVNGGVIANFADDTEAGNRRFYYRPDVALIVTNEGRFLSVSIGSGFRANPLNTAIDDRFYMLKQHTTHGKPSSYTTRTEADLHDATDNLIMEGEPDEKELAKQELSATHENAKQGWFIRLENSGEKVLSASTTILNQVVFTTYEPTPPDTGTCEPKHGTNRIYAVDAVFGAPVGDTNNDGVIDKSDRVAQLKTGSIASTPTVIDTIDSKPTVWVGTERIDHINTDVDSVRTYWIEESN